MLEVRANPGQQVGVHAHETGEIFYIVKGEMIFGQHTLKPGDSIYIPGMMLYSFKAGPEGVQFLNLRPRVDLTHFWPDDIKALDALPAADRPAFITDNVEKAKRTTLPDDEVLAVLAREVKTRRESVEAFRGGGREDLAAKEEAEIAILAEYLPQQLGEAELRALIAEAIAATGAASPKEMGKVMGWLSPKVRGRADGKQVSALVTAALAEAAG